MFSINHYGVFFSPKFKQHSPLRILSEYEIELYPSANATGLLDGEEFVYPEGHVCIFRPGQQRRSLGQFSAYYLKFSCAQDEICQYLDQLPSVIHCSDNKEIYRLFHEIFDAMAQKQTGYKLYTYAKTAELISLLYAASHTATDTGGKYTVYNGQVYESIRFMKEHIGERITLEDIAAYVHLSPSFFHVVFKDIIQKTPHRYLLEMRLAMAKNLLINSDLSLGLIAEQCGFDSQVYFNYIIKKELGTTPKKYRDTNQNRFYTI